ncbi:MAG: GDP-mannose 4,6-dehydratase [Waddliaceae bacterium]|nr:GDP-mannose 4,6-dehydratase [Waddliaceae bacterium]MBT7461956.1 GDP-mannose 4,6-dehydratase [Waddliaceae bacterium]
MKKALVCGVSGQDGAYLSKLLLSKGYDVIGTSRDATTSTFAGLKKVGVYDDIEKVSMAISDFRSVASVLKKYRPDEIYNLAGQSSVGLSFEQPVETIDSIVTGTLNILEAIRFEERDIKFYNAGSSECFGDIGDTPADENTPFKPRSPYALAKASAYNLISVYREAYGLFACTGILFNHESPLRYERFVTQKIVKAAARIAAGSKEKLKLGNIDIYRDWGWAPEYAEAIWLILQQQKPQDFVVATGKTISLTEFVEKAFAYFNLDWKEHVDVDESSLRPLDIHMGKANPKKAEEILGWKATSDVDDVVRMMCDDAKQG